MLSVKPFLKSFYVRAARKASLNYMCAVEFDCAITIGVSDSAEKPAEELGDIEATSFRRGPVTGSFLSARITNERL